MSHAQGAGRMQHTMECESATAASSSLNLYMADAGRLNKQVPAWLFSFERAHFQSWSRFLTAKAGDGTSPVLP